MKGQRLQTSKTVDSPLFELFEGYINSGGNGIEVKPMVILQLFVLRLRKLLPAMIDRRFPLRINPKRILPDHFEA